MQKQELAAALDHVRKHGPEYFPDLESSPVEVIVIRKKERAQSRLYWLELRARDRRHRVLVKVRPEDAPVTSGPRPRLGRVEDAVLKPQAEFDCLVAVHEHLLRAGNTAFGAVRPLGFLPDQRAIIMDVIEAPTLRRLLLPQNRLGAFLFGSDLSVFFERAGAWLRLFHELPHKAKLPPLRQTADEVADSFPIFTTYLERTPAHDALLGEIAEAAQADVTRSLPRVLPLGPGHGDYAPRNVFVSADGRITVIDPLGTSRVPVYEDIAYFLVWLRTMRIQIVTGGLAFDSSQLDQYERALVRGYFGESDIPWKAIRIFELLVLLDRWSSAAAASRGNGLSRWPRVASRALTNRYFVEEARRLAGLMTAA